MNENNSREVISHEKELTCYELGVKFGRCGTQILYDMPFDTADDIRIPERCKFDPETKKGIKDGVMQVYEMATEVVRRMQKPINQKEE